LNPDQQGHKAYVLLAWANNHKKSSLGVLTLLLINSQSCWSGTIQRQLETISGGDISVDQHSLHRLLRRLEHLDLIHAEEVPTDGGGAHRRNFVMTAYGRQVLHDHCATTLGYLRSTAFQHMLDLALDPAVDVDSVQPSPAHRVLPARILRPPASAS
jgi:DNA-binding PadR family transcriptional regulator